METWPLSETPCDGCGKPLNTKQGGSFVASSDGKSWHYGCAPIINRRTADLGEDGELVEKLRAIVYEELTFSEDFALEGDKRKAITEAADRLILYREALAEAEAYLAAGAGWTNAELENPVMARACGMGCREGLRKLRDVLSRGGG